MKPILHYILILFFSFSLVACEKVIDLPANHAPERYVVEGVITNEAGGCVVKISTTSKLNDVNRFNTVRGAIVQVSGDGSTVTLAETTPGVYRTDLAGKPGTQYTLRVEVAGNRFTAQSWMPVVVPIDSLYVSAMELVNEKLLQPHVVFNDPALAGNYYRFVQYRNGVKDRDIFVLDDLLTNGKRNNTTLFQDAEDEDNRIKSGDKLQVELQSIEQPVYSYWVSLYQGALGQDGAASPANPVSNISGGALGYFSAHGVSRKVIDVK